MQDILYNVFQHLPIKDVVTCMLVNKFFNECALVEHMWKDWVQYNFNSKLFFDNYYKTYEVCYKLTKLKIEMHMEDHIDKIYEKERHEIPHGPGPVGYKYPIIPKEINQLQNLQSLGARYQMHNFVIPPEIGQLSNLTYIYFEDSNVKNLPKTIGDLNNLKICNIYGCRLIDIPTEMGKLHNLERLCLWKNLLVSIPIELGNLINLVKLDLSYNNIESVPQEIENLENLEDLSLSGNQFGLITVDTSRMTKLVRLCI
jgi:Leucine-rich repeat (LRR) protein